MHFNRESVLPLGIDIYLIGGQRHIRAIFILQGNKLIFIRGVIIMFFVLKIMIPSLEMTHHPLDSLPLPNI